MLGEGVCKAPYEWIVYDTWSELQYYMMEQLRKDRDRGPFTGSLEFRKNVEIQDWQAMTDLNKLAIEELRKCPVNQIFTMQEGYKEDPKTKDLHWGPAIHGKLVQEIPTYFSIVVHTATTTIGGFTATTKSKGRWPAKTRRGEGKDFTDPTIKEVISK